MTTTTTVIDHRSGATYERSGDAFEVDPATARRDLASLARRADPSPALDAIRDIEAGRSTVYESSDEFLSSLASR